MSASFVGGLAAVLRAAEYRLYGRPQDYTFGSIGGVVACRASADRHMLVPHSHVFTYAVRILQVRSEFMVQMCLEVEERQVSRALKRPSALYIEVDSTNS